MHILIFSILGIGALYILVQVLIQLLTALAMLLIPGIILFVAYIIWKK